MSKHDEPVVMPQRVCTGKAPDLTHWAGWDVENLTYCQSTYAYACVRCGHGVEEDHATWCFLTNRPRCNNGCHWTPCTRVGGCTGPVKPRLGACRAWTGQLIYIEQQDYESVLDLDHGFVDRPIEQHPCVGGG